MSNILTKLAREIRSNALYDIVKYMIICAVSLLAVFGYRILAWAREIPQDRVIDGVIFAAAFLLLTAAYALSKRQQRAAVSNSGDTVARAIMDQLPRVIDGGIVQSEASPEERIFVNVAPEYLTSFYMEHTEIQADRLAAAYIGKWLKLSGSISHVGKADELISVALELKSDKSDPYTVAYFSEKRWKDRAEILRKGDALTVIGQITRLTRSSIRLENCEIVESQPPA